MKLFFDIVATIGPSKSLASDLICPGIELQSPVPEAKARYNSTI